MMINNTVDTYNLVDQDIITKETVEQRDALLNLFPKETGERRRLNVASWQEAVRGALRPLGLGECEEGFGAGYEESWGVGCTLYINPVVDWEYHVRTNLPNGAMVTLRRMCDTKVELSWSATTRNTETALAAVNLYQRVLGYAATLRASLADKLYMTDDQWAEIIVAAAKTPEQVAEETRVAAARRAEREAKEAAKAARKLKAEAKKLAKS